MITSDSLKESAVAAGDLMCDYLDEINDGLKNSKTGRITVNISVCYRLCSKGLESKVRIKAKTGEISDEILSIDEKQNKIEGMG